jgi:hypothetical protein
MCSSQSAEFCDEDAQHINKPRTQCFCRKWRSMLQLTIDLFDSNNNTKMPEFPALQSDALTNIESIIGSNNDTYFFSKTIHNYVIHNSRTAGPGYSARFWGRRRMRYVWYNAKCHCVTLIGMPMRGRWDRCDPDGRRFSR